MIHNSLINAKWLKEFSVLPLNYNTKEIENFISIAEKIWVIPVIGYTFYEELLEQVKENNLTDVNSTALVEAIYPYLAMAVCYEALPSLWIHCNEVGLTLGSSDNSSSATLKDMTYYEQWIRRQLEARKDYCKKWLCQRFEYFPDLDVCACNCDCCNNNAKLQKPNAYQQLYTPPRRCTNLR
jgi:hypothetical protein